VTVVPLRRDWPGLTVGTHRVVHDGAGLGDVAHRLREWAAQLASPGKGSSHALRFAGGRCAQCHARWTAAELLAHLQRRSVFHAGAVLEALPPNLEAMAARLGAVSERYLLAEEEILAEVRSLRRLSAADIRERYGSASVFAWEPRRASAPRYLPHIPPAQPVRDIVSFSVVGVPYEGAPPGVRTIVSWLRELQREMAWRPLVELAAEWRSLADRMEPLRHRLFSAAGHLEQSWYDRAAPLGQQALRRIDGTAYVLEVFARTLEPRTEAIARCMEQVASLRLGGWQRSDEERIRAVFLDLDNCFRWFLVAHPQELAYDLPFGGDLPHADGARLFWPEHPKPPEQVAPVIGGSPRPSPPPADFWLPPEDVSPSVIG
jgi:hypothetical protein